MNRKFARSFFALSLLFLLVTSLRADPVDDFVRAQMLERHIPGAAIAVIKNGQMVKSQGYGLASVEFKVPATGETVFEIGSISKQITAAGIMLLVEEGKVNLDEKISRYLPNTPDAWKNVSVRHLLTHTSGIKSYTGLSGFELSKRLTRDEFIKSLAAYPLEFETGASWKYSNSGYNLLGFIIEAVAQKNYWDFMCERVFAPLGMAHTADRDPKYIIPNRATGYEWTLNRLVGRDYDLTDVFAAGAIVSTVTDLAKWEAALGGDAFLKKESKTQIWTPMTLNDGKPYPYGFGWNVGEFRGHRLLSHGGQTAGFAANISRYTDDNLTVIVLTNLGDRGLGSVVARGVAKIYIPEISLKALKAQSVTNVSETKMIETAFRSYLENKIDDASFTEEMRRTLANESRKAAAKRIAAFGAVKNFFFVGGETAGTKRLYRFKAESLGKLTLWRFSINENNQIAEMVLEEEE